MIDLRATIRGLGRRPAFSFSAALSLGLGMALVTVVFSVMVAVFFAPLPFARPDRLVTIATLAQGSLGSAAIPAIGPREVIVGQDARHLFDFVSAVTYESYIVGRNGDAREYPGARVSANFFEMLRVRPLAGRLFEPVDGQVGGANQVVISEEFWRTRFGSDPKVVGASIVVDGAERQLIGVVPTSLAYPRGDVLWTLMTDDSLRARARNNATYFTAVARLASGVTSKRAEAELAALFNASERQFGQDPHWRVELKPLASLEENAQRDTIELWMAAAIMVLLLCAVNFATMMLSRGMQRRAEIAVRSACGGSVGRLIWLLLVEAGCLAGLGGTLAILFAAMGIGAVRSALSASALSTLPEINPATMALTLAGTSAVGMLFALLPAIELARADLRPLLSGGSTKATGSDRELRGRRGLVALQVAFAVASVVVIVAVVQVQLRDFEGGPGHAYDKVITARLRVTDTAHWSDDALLTQLRSIDVVTDAAIVRNHEIAAFRPEGAAPGVIPHVYWSDVTPSFFSTDGVELIAGRVPTQADADAGLPVAVLSERVLRWLQCTTCARQQVVSASDNFLGRKMTMKLSQGMEQAFTVVGVVKDIRSAPKFNRVDAPVYTINAIRAPRTGASLYVRVRGNRQQALERIANDLRSSSTRAIISDLRLVHRDVDQWQTASRSKLLFLIGAASFALILALVGVYSLTTHTAALRTREFGIRLALGATDARVVRMLVSEIWRMAALGSLIGLGVAWRATNSLDGYLNPFAFHSAISVPIVPTVAGTCALLFIGIVGTVLPARKAMRLDIARVIMNDS